MTPQLDQFLKEQRIEPPANGVFRIGDEEFLMISSNIESTWDHQRIAGKARIYVDPGGKVVPGPFDMYGPKMRIRITWPKRFEGRSLCGTELTIHFEVL